MHTGAQRNDAKQQGIEWYEGERTIQSFYDSDITSYDYQAPISEAGDYGQPGSGGPNKFEVGFPLCPSLCCPACAGHNWPLQAFVSGRQGTQRAFGFVPAICNAIVMFCSAVTLVLVKDSSQLSAD